MVLRLKGSIKEEEEEEQDKNRRLSSTQNFNQINPMNSSSDIISVSPDAASATGAIHDTAASAAAAESSQEVPPEWFQNIATSFARNMNLSPPRDLDLFPTVFNMSRRTFVYICSLVRNYMPLIPCPLFTFRDGSPMSLYDQVAVALRRLSSASSLDQIGAPFRVDGEMVSEVAWQFVGAMVLRGHGHIKLPRSQQEMATLKSKFEQIRGLPNCCGAVDVTHIQVMLSRSAHGANSWLDHDNTHSMVLIGVVDPDLRFLEAVIAEPRTLSDSKFLQISPFFQSCQTGERLNGEKVRLSETAEMQEFIVGDEGFPLLPWLMTPYQGSNLTEVQADFNRRLMVTHAVSQKALARLKEVWKMIDGVMWRPKMYKLRWYVLACCILHNIIIDMEDDVLDTLPVSQNHDPGYPTPPCDYADGGAVISRDNLSHHLFGRVDANQVKREELKCGCSIL